MIIHYLKCALGTVLLTLVAWLLSILQILPLFIRAGQYPSWLSYFQTPDAPAWGTDSFQEKQMLCIRNWPTAIRLHLCAVFWQLRNPAQGFDTYCKADIDMMDMVKSYGDTGIRAGCTESADGYDQPGYAGWFLITHRKGYFHFRAIIALGSICYSPEFGWRLHGMVDGFPSAMCKQMVFSPVRFLKFVR